MSIPESSIKNVTKQSIKKTWWKECSVYQIYPASFKDSNGDGIGDIPGIISELDYVKNLGADILWLSPVLTSPQVDMGYDIANYKDIHRPYGTMEDHDALIKGLHDRGMKYVLDLVVNHTSSEHEWFKQSRSSKDNPYRDWYYWKPARYDDEGNRIPPNNWKAAFEGSVWEWDEATQEYYLHLFAVEQPDLNWENPKVVEAVHDVVRFWLKRGVDGFRMDVINFISKTPGLPDASIKIPGFLQPAIEHFSCGPRLHEFLKGLGSILAEYEAFSVGEMPGVNDTKEIIKGVGQDRGELAMAFQFEIVGLDRSDKDKFLPRDWTIPDLKHVVNKWNTFMLANGGWNALYMENHDQGRTVSRYLSDAPEYRTKSGKNIAAHLGLQSGTPFIFQAQELAHADIPKSWGIDKYRDLECLNHWATAQREYPEDKERLAINMEMYRLIGRDSARTPVQWSAAKHAGFMPESTPDGVKPWMDYHEDYETWNAANAVADPNSTYHYWRRILQLRKQYKGIFVYGDFEMLDLEHPYVIAYVRSLDDEHKDGAAGPETKALVLTSWGGEDREGGKEGGWYKIPSGYGRFVKDGVIKELRNYEDDAQVKEAGGDVWVKLRPYETLVAML